MNILADSSSVCLTRKVLTQHHAAITLLLQKLKSPDVIHFEWIDVACGQGQILTNLEGVLGPDLRKKITFHAYDVDKDSLAIAIEMANKLEFGEVKDKIGQIEDFHALMKNSKFNFITLTNSFHEFDPFCIPELFVDLLLHLQPNGLLYVFDMEQLPTPELGAITWTRAEIESIIRKVFENLGDISYVPEVSAWPLSSIRAWSFQIDMTHITGGIPFSVESQKNAIDSAKNLIKELLDQKLSLCSKILKALKNKREDSPTEKLVLDNAIYGFWALNDIIGGKNG